MTRSGQEALMMSA